MLGIDLANELRGDYLVIGTDLVKNKESVLDRFYKSDITDRKSIADCISRAKPDIVVHTAAWTDVDGCELDKKKAYAVNFAGARNVAQACKRINAAMIYISTDFVFSGRKSKPYRESDKTGPLNVYADSKLKGEAAVKKALKKYFILRTSWLYGRHGKNFVDTITAKAKKDGSLRVVSDQAGSPTYTVDLAKAIHALIDRVVTCHMSHVTCHGVYHVSNAGSVSWYGYAKTIIGTANIRARVTAISSKVLARPAERPAMSVMDNSKFKRFAGYKMRGWKSALREYLNLKRQETICCRG